LYSRTEADLIPEVSECVRDTVDVYPSYATDEAYRIHFFGDEIGIESFDTKTHKSLKNLIG
jgi:excinuclease UvrABC helicase subunit UvrB